MKKRLKRKLYHRLARIKSEVRAADQCAATRMEFYESEMRFVVDCILACPNIETGGELFGFWKDDGSAVVAYVLGPGCKANHRYAFFNQDMDYLNNIGEKLTGVYGLEHIGEWHSHHSLGLNKPSGHDAETMANGIRAAGRNRMALVIGTIEGKLVVPNAYLFSAVNGREYSAAHISLVKHRSPYREMVDKENPGVIVLPDNAKEVRHG